MSKEEKTTSKKKLSDLSEGTGREASSINERLEDELKLNEHMILREDLPDSPFTIITIDGKSFGTMGKYRLTEEYDKIESVRKELRNKSWNRIIQVMMLVCKEQENLKVFDNE